MSDDRALCQKSSDEKLREGIVKWLDRAAQIEEAARAVVEAEGPSTGQRTDFWAAVDRLREVLDA